MIQFMELADYIVAGSALIGGILIGRRMRPERPEPIRPICSCDHGYGTHDADGGGCHAETLVQFTAYKANQRLAPCPCKRYDGPDPAIFGLAV